MADQSSQDWRARTGADTQRVNSLCVRSCLRMTYARAPLQVRRGGRTTTSMYCDTTVSKLLARSTSHNYIQCLLPQPFVPACPMPCPCLCERSVCYTCCVYIDLSSRIFAYGPLGRRVHTPLSLCMHAHCYCAIYSENVHARSSACGCMHTSFLQYVANTGF